MIFKNISSLNLNRLILWSIWVLSNRKFLLILFLLCCLSILATTTMMRRIIIISSNNINNNQNKRSNNMKKNGTNICTTSDCFSNYTEVLIFWASWMGLCYNQLGLKRLSTSVERIIIIIIYCNKKQKQLQESNKTIDANSMDQKPVTITTFPCKHY